MKQGFQNDFAVLKTRDGHNFIVVEPIVYVTKLGAVLTIPAGTTTDGASTPAAIWFKLPPFGLYFLPAILHDFLYRNTRMAKANCDDLFKEAMLSCGVDEATAETIYQGVHLGGQSSFDEDRALLSAAQIPS